MLEATDWQLLQPKLKDIVDRQDWLGGERLFAAADDEQNPPRSRSTCALARPTEAGTAAMGRDQLDPVRLPLRC